MYRSNFKHPKLHIFAIIIIYFMFWEKNGMNTRFVNTVQKIYYRCVDKWIEIAKPNANTVVIFVFSLSCICTLAHFIMIALHDYSKLDINQNTKQNRSLVIVYVYFSFYGFILDQSFNFQSLVCFHAGSAGRGLSTSSPALLQTLWILHYPVQPQVVHSVRKQYSKPITIINKLRNIFFQILSVDHVQYDL